jgi:hypothetical protein
MHMPKAWIILKILGLFLVALLAALLAFVVLQPPLKPLSHQNVPLTLLGYTNDDHAGSRLAVFAVTNLSGSVILVRQPMIEGLVYDRSNWPTWRVMLDSGASATFTVPVPTNLSPWRLGIYAVNDIGTTRAIIRTVRGFPFTAARRHPYGIDSDWIDNKK